MQSARQLGSAENRRGIRIADEVAGRCTGGTRADPARIVIVAGLGFEKVAPLDEERTPFVEDGLEHGQVHFSGIGFDLPEVGIHGCLERQIRANADLHVRADAARQIETAVKGVVRIPVARHAR